MRVYELAKELKLTSKELIAQLKELKIDVKGHMSSIDEDAQQRVRSHISGGTATATVAKPKAKKATKAQPKAQTKTEAAPKPKAEKAPKKVEEKPAPKAQPKTEAKPQAKPQPKPVPPKAEPKVEEPVVEEPVAEQPAPASAPEKPSDLKPLELNFPVTVGEFAGKMNVKPTEVIKKLMAQKIFATMNQNIKEEDALVVAEAFGFELVEQPSLEEQLEQMCKPDEAKMVPRAPVVTFMGHVDHGKTSLLDAIRKATVADSEHGGITQHIGAYEVRLEKGQVTFLDTPGHEAFTALRARGANVTDVVVLVVAADDGVMPQTIEAIDHAKAAEVPIVVAINKIDRPEADVQRITQQLAQYELLSEEWGGKTIMVPVSAKTQEGIEDLLEMLLLEAELLELKADPTVPACGVVIEGKHTKHRGSVVTLLVQQGTLKVGEMVVVGEHSGRVRAMVGDRGRNRKEAGPATPIEILGLPDVPQAGDKFIAVADERAARQLAQQRVEQKAQKGGLDHPRHLTLEEVHQRITEGELKEFRMILKSDVQGSLEAITQSLQKLDAQTPEIRFRILHSGVGDINESDIILAAASDAIIFGFHVGMNPQVQVAAINEGVDVHLYQIIYDMVNAIRGAIEGLLDPDLEESFIGRAEVRQLFKVSKGGNAGGCMVVKGSMRRDCQVRLIRDDERIYEGKMSSLRRMKDDVKEVQEGVECGIALDGNADIQIGDFIEAWEVKKVARKLN